jgi:hypothetical protein
MTQKMPFLEIDCSFIFVRHLDVMHHNAFYNLACLSNKVIYLKNILLFCLVWFYNNLPIANLICFKALFNPSLVLPQIMAARIRKKGEKKRGPT